MSQSSKRATRFGEVLEISLDEPPALIHPEWTVDFPWLLQGTTTRGRAREPFDLGLFSDGLPKVGVRANWGALCGSTGFDVALLAPQVHEATVRIADPGPGASSNGVPRLTDPCDGHATARPGLLLAVTTADCVPVFLVEPEHRVVAVLHAGWRGTAAGVLEEGLRVLTDDLGAELRRVHLHLGPAICGSCYEVGPEVFRALGRAEPGAPAPIDLRDILGERAVEAGVPADQIEISSHCTRCTGSRLFSHRAGDGCRQVGYMGIRPANDS